MKTKTKTTFRPFRHRAIAAQAATQTEKLHPKLRVISNQSVVRLIVAINHWFQTDIFEVGRALVEFTAEHLSIILTVTSDADDQNDFKRFRGLVESLDAPVHLEWDAWSSQMTGNTCWRMNLKLTSGADIDDLAATLIKRAEEASEKSSYYPHGARVQEAIVANERTGGFFKVSMRPVNTKVTDYSIQSI